MKKNRYEKNMSGFIVHPNMTVNRKYHASYGRNHNKTVVNFRTLKSAKAYLKRKGVSGGIYDSPRRPKEFRIK